MANLRRIPTTHEGLFPVPLVLLGVEPEVDFDLRKAGNVDPQKRDKDTGERCWSVSVLDSSQDAGRRELKVRVVAPVQPVPPTGIGLPVEFDGLECVPWVDNRGGRSRVEVSLRASGFRSAPKPAKAAVS